MAVENNESKSLLNRHQETQKSHFDPFKENWVETDASVYVAAAVLSQTGTDGLLHPVAYTAKQMSSVEANFSIYDKELVTIMRAFEEWALGMRRNLRSRSHPSHQWSPEPRARFMTTKQLKPLSSSLGGISLGIQTSRSHMVQNTQDIKSKSLTRRTQNLSQVKVWARRQFSSTRSFSRKLTWKKWTIVRIHHNVRNLVLKLPRRTGKLERESSSTLSLERSFCVLKPDRSKSELISIAVWNWRFS